MLCALSFDTNNCVRTLRGWPCRFLYSIGRNRHNPFRSNQLPSQHNLKNRRRNKEARVNRRHCSGKGLKFRLRLIYELKDTPVTLRKIAMAVLARCVCSTSSTSPLLQQAEIGRSRAQQHQQGYVVSWNRTIQGPRPLSSLLEQRSTAPLQHERRGAVMCQVAVKIGQSSEGKETNVGPGSKIRVTAPLTVYHVVKLPNFQLQGVEGAVKEHIVEWKGKAISATLPYKVQFVKEVDGKAVRFFVHLREDEFEVIE